MDAFFKCFNFTNAIWFLQYEFLKVFSKNSELNRLLRLINVIWIVEFTITKTITGFKIIKIQNGQFFVKKNQLIFNLEN